MTEREMLELAAKAAGILPLPPGKELDSAADGGLAICGGGEYIVWNPRDDDGDSRRLQVQLKIRLIIADDEIWANDVQIYGFDDAYKATRLAILCAAAAIGKQMEEREG